MYRPHGVLAKALYNKCLADEKLFLYDKSKVSAMTRKNTKVQWYQCDLNDLHCDIAALFLPLEIDNDTTAFLENATEKSEWIFTQLWHNIASAFLGWFISQTSINGLLGRGSMFVFSKQQFLLLLASRCNWGNDSLLDIGAGDGATTEIIAPLFRNVFVTEVSLPMCWALRRKGFTLLDPDMWEQSGLQFDVITCLNLLDRCSKPLSLLKTLHMSLAQNGTLVIALVLPFQPYVETGQMDHQPSERLPIQGVTFEEQVQSVIEDVFLASGFKVLSWSRLPYLCEGDLNQAYYWLDDAVFVLQKLHSCDEHSGDLLAIKNSELNCEKVACAFVS